VGTRAGGQWVDLKTAADVMSTTTEAVRKRAKRGTLPSETGEDGRLYVRVDSQVDDQVDGRANGVHPDRVLLVERMASEIDHLREQLREERAGSAELRRIVAGLVQRVPELESVSNGSPEPRESSVTVSEDTHKGTTPTEQEPSQRRSWLHRFFFGPESE
jgi:hypothetical protein